MTTIGSERPLVRCHGVMAEQALRPISHPSTFAILPPKCHVLRPMRFPWWVWPDQAGPARQAQWPSSTLYPTGRLRAFWRLVYGHGYMSP